MDVGPRYPCLFLRHLRSFSVAGLKSLQLGYRRVRSLSSRGPEMVECRNVAQPALESRDLRDRLDLLGGAGHRRVLGVPRGPEQRFDLRIRESIHECRATDRGFAAPGRDFLAKPLEVLARLGAEGQGIHGVLDRDGTQSLQAPPNLDPEIVGLRRELMEQQ